MSEFHPLRSLREETNMSADWAKKNCDAVKLAKDIRCAPMPSLDHLKMKDFEEVYEPSDDTVRISSSSLVVEMWTVGNTIIGVTYFVPLQFNLSQYLLLDALHSEVENGIFATMNGPILLEIGCGSGTVSTFLASQLLRKGIDPLVFATDINPRALEVTKETSGANSGGSSGSIRLEVVRCDLVSALLPRLNHSVDCLVFNPPYVPTPDVEVGGTSIEASWAGGVNGRRVIDRAIPQMAQIMARPNGVAYMITVDDNQPEELASIFRKLDLDVKPLVRRRAQNEYLTVQKISWIQT